MLVEKDKEIINYISDFGFITIGQCYSMWFNDRKYGYDLSRKHLNKIEKNGYIKSYKPVSNIYAEKVFYMDEKYVTPTRSMVISMNVYAELKRLGAEILHFKREERWLDDKYRSDAFTVFKMNRFVFSSCIEVIDTTKLTQTAHKKSFISKYENIYASNEPTEKIKNITNIKKDFELPTLIVISELGKYNLDLPKEINVVYLDYSLQKLSQIFI